MATPARRYALFVAIPAIGHANPLLRQAEELVRRGWRAALASGSELREHVSRSAPSVGFVDLGATPETTAATVAAMEAATREPSFLRSATLIVERMTPSWPLLYDGLVDAIGRDRPDVIVVDLMTAAGFDAAETTGVPYVVNDADLLASVAAALLPAAPEVPLMFTGRSITRVGPIDRLLHRPLVGLSLSLSALTVGRRLNGVRASRGLAPIDVNRRLADKLILVDTAFGLEYPRPVPPLIQLVGPMIERDPAPLPDELRAWIDDGPPVVYVNLGTLARPAPDLLARLVAGLASPDLRALWVLSSELRARLPAQLPSNVRMESWVPSSLSVLAHPNVPAFLSHCGINSAHEALHAGTPIVCLPLFADQRDMAQRVVDAGVGLLLDKATFGPDELRAALARAATDPALRRNIPAIQSSFALAGGVARAADLIEHAAAVGVDHYRVGRAPT